MTPGDEWSEIISLRPFLHRSAHEWLFSLAAGTAALGINQFGLPIFGGTELIFGGWLVLTIVFAYGAGPGLLAAFIAYSTTLWSWGHPWGLIVGTLEAACVGWMVQHLKWSRIRAVLVFWAAVGLPVTLLGIFRYTEIPFPANAAIVGKYGANSLLMAMLAIPLVDFALVRRWLRLPQDHQADWPLQRVLFQRFGITIGITLAVLAIFVGRSFDRTLRQLAEDRLTHDAQEVARDLDHMLDIHRQVLKSLASDGDMPLPPAKLTARLERMRADFPAFITMLGANAAGTIVAAAPDISPDGSRISSSGISVADRAYFRLPMATGESYLSEVFRGRGFGADLIVALSVPVRDSMGKPIFIVEGSIDFQRVIAQIAAPSARRNRSLLVVDNADQVVASEGALAKPSLTKLGNDPLAVAAARADQRPFTLVRDGPERRESFLIARAPVADTGWQIYLAEPVWSYQQLVAGFYLATFLAAGIASLGALAFAGISARNVTQPLSNLVADMQALARGEDLKRTDGESHPGRELSELSRAAQNAALTLSRANRELASALDQRNRTHEQLRQVLLHLDEKVRQRTEQLEDALQQAESANRTKGEFIAATSHELRTPLNVILGMSEVLLDRTLGELTPRQRESVQAIEESGRHLLSLINDILDLSKIEAGQLHLQLQEVALRDLCEASLRFVRTQAAKKSQSLVLEIRTPVESLVGDARRLKQILVNLLSNAVKFTADGGSIALEVSDASSGRALRFDVVDNGIGIEPAHLARLFQPFQQIDGALNRRHNGTGLGLALVRRLAELHGGVATVESKPGAGSRFTVVIPLGSESTPPMELPKPALRETPPDQPAAGRHILIAEDNDANLLFYRQCRPLAGARLSVARNGREALDLAFAEPPDLIIMDVQMPKMDGLEAMRCLRADPRTAKTPILAVTAQALPEDRARCFEAGATSYLSKPVSLRDLARQVADALSSIPARRP